MKAVVTISGDTFYAAPFQSHPTKGATQGRVGTIQTASPEMAPPNWGKDAVHGRRPTN